MEAVKKLQVEEEDGLIFISRFMTIYANQYLTLTKEEAKELITKLQEIINDSEN